MCEGIPWSSEKSWALKGVQHDARADKLPKLGVPWDVPFRNSWDLFVQPFSGWDCDVKNDIHSTKNMSPSQFNKIPPSTKNDSSLSLKKSAPQQRIEPPPLNLKNPPSRKKNYPPPSPSLQKPPFNKKNVPLPITKKSPLNLQQSSHNQKGDLSFMWGVFFQSTKSINQ